MMHNFFIPIEILKPWITKENSGACKLWRKMWYDSLISCDIVNDCISVNFLSNFTNLSHLGIYANVDDVTFLKKIAMQLKSFYYIGDNFDDNILRRLTNLTSLNYNSKNVTNSGLVRMTQLSHLTLYYKCNITCDTLRCLINLTSLAVDGNNRTVLDCIYRSNTKLTNLYLYRNNITNSMLSRFEHITTLRVVCCPKIWDKGLEKMTQLLSLELVDVEYVSDKSIEKLTNLTRLCVYGRNRVPIRSLNKLTQLQHLEIPDNFAHIRSALTLPNMATFVNAKCEDRKSRNHREF